MRRSFSETIRRCWSPATTRSSAVSNSICRMYWRSLRPAKIAASLHRFARSAPVRPAVRLAPFHVRRRDEHLPVESARAEQCRIEVLEPVRRGHHDDLLGRIESVELDEELVQRLVLLAVVAVPGASRADRVELVDEDDRGG